MKCEICHQADAETVLKRGEGEAAEELYVCQACARAARLHRQKKNQRTRKVTELPPGVSLTIDELPHPSAVEDMPKDLFKALMKSVDGILSEMSGESSEAASKTGEKEMYDFPLSRVAADFRIRGKLHLEGLHMIGELDAVKRALHALEMNLDGQTADGVHDTGHVYGLSYSGASARAKRVVEAILREERNARVRLVEEMPRVFGDAICRALAILKNCRLLSSGEFFDLLSPLRLAAREGMLDGLSLKEIDKMLLETDLSNSEDRLEQSERDRIDAERADEMNRRFEDVVLNERGEEKFL